MYDTLIAFHILELIQESLEKIRIRFSGTWRNNKESGNHHAVSSLGEAAWRMPLRMICFSSLQVIQHLFYHL